MLKGRLGLDESGIRHENRHPFVYLDRGELSADSGGLVFSSGATKVVLPVQSLSAVMIGPGSSVTHDALRLLSVYGTCLVAVGADGVRCYTAPPVTTARSGLARKHAAIWAEEISRINIARRMYALRFGELLPHRDLNVLRGIEGARVKAQYRIIAQRYGVEWRGRHYDRANPELSDTANAAINHASSAAEAAASIAVTAVGAIPQLGFIHEDPGQSFVLDVADLYRATLILPSAFEGMLTLDRFGGNLERAVRLTAAQNMKKLNVIGSMMGIVKALILDETLPEGTGLSESWRR